MALVLATVLLLNVKSQAQLSFFDVQDIDSSGYEWTAMTANHNSVYICTQPSGSNMTPPTGDLRLRSYSTVAPQIGTTAQTIRFKAKANVSHMAMFNADIVLTGSFHDSCFFGMDTLVGLEPNKLDAFVMRINPTSQQIAWVWNKRETRNNYLHKIRDSGNAGHLFGTGIANDTTGWLVILNGHTGQLIYEKRFPGVRTLSDATYDPIFSDALIITGTMSDAGQISQVPVPLSFHVTGYSSFIARYFPANDSVVFLASLPCDTTSFEPVLVKTDASPFIDWVAPEAINWDSADYKRQIYHKFEIPGGYDTIEYFHDSAISFVENSMPLFVYGPQNFYLLKTFNSPQHTYEFGYVHHVSIATINPHLTHPSPLLTSLYLTNELFALKTSGIVSLAFEPGANYPDTSLSFSAATAAQPKWVLFKTTTNWGGSVKNINVPSVRIYPNPVTNNQFKVQFNESIHFDLPWLLRDLQGRVVQQGVLQPDENEIHCGQLPKGMYLFELQSPAGSSVQKVLIH